MTTNSSSLSAQDKRTLQEMSRSQICAKLMADILADMQMCDVEGWEKSEFMQQVQDSINSIGNKRTKLANLSNVISRLIDEIETGGMKCSVSFHTSLRSMFNIVERELSNL